MVAKLGRGFLLAFISTSLSLGSCASENEIEMNIDTITLGAGCFWCVEAVFDQIQGVNQVTSGYMGGQIKNPSYREVCTGRTGHAEVVQIQFDPSQVSTETILEVFFSTHDPTQLNRQGADVGTQYRSVIFVRNEKERDLAEESIAKHQHLFQEKIVTTIEDESAFYVAEDYHQSYYELHGEAPYCKAVIRPKISKLQSQFQPLLKSVN